MVTTTRYSRASDNGDSAVTTTNLAVTTIALTLTTTSFSAAATAEGGDKHLVPRNHIASAQHPMSSYQFSPIVGMSHFPIFAQQPPMFNPYFQ